MSVSFKDYREELYWLAAQEQPVPASTEMLRILCPYFSWDDFGTLSDQHGTGCVALPPLSVLGGHFLARIRRSSHTIELMPEYEQPYDRNVWVAYADKAAAHATTDWPERLLNPQDVLGVFNVALCSPEFFIDGQGRESVAQAKVCTSVGLGEIRKATDRQNAWRDATLRATTGRLERLEVVAMTGSMGVYTPMCSWCGGALFNCLDDDGQSSHTCIPSVARAKPILNQSFAFHITPELLSVFVGAGHRFKSNPCELWS